MMGGYIPGTETLCRQLGAKDEFRYKYGLFWWKWDRRKGRVNGLVPLLTRSFDGGIWTGGIVKWDLGRRGGRSRFFGEGKDFHLVVMVKFECAVSVDRSKLLDDSMGAPERIFVCRRRISRRSRKKVVRLWEEFIGKNCMKGTLFCGGLDELSVGEGEMDDLPIPSDGHAGSGKGVRVVGNLGEKKDEEVYGETSEVRVDQGGSVVGSLGVSEESWEWELDYDSDSSCTVF